VDPAVHLFSTRVADVSFKDLAEGKCPTTGGTAIECVIDHMRVHEIRRAVVVTDGFVGRPQGKNAEYLRGITLGVAYTPGTTAQDTLRDFVRSTVNLA
jgi:hypothetical protein